MAAPKTFTKLPIPPRNGNNLSLRRFRESRKVSNLNFVFARWQVFLVPACLIATIAANVFASNARVPMLEGNWTVIQVDDPMGNSLTKQLIAPGKTFRIEHDGSMIGELRNFTGIIAPGKCRAYCFTLVDIATVQEFKAILSKDSATLSFTGSKGDFFTARRH